MELKMNISKYAAVFGINSILLFSFAFILEMEKWENNGIKFLYMIIIFINMAACFIQLIYDNEQ